MKFMKYLNRYGIPQTRENKMYVDNTLKPIEGEILTGDMLFCKRYKNFTLSCWKAIKNGKIGVLLELRNLFEINEEFIAID